MPVRERLLRSSRHVLDSAAWRPFRGGQKRPRRPSTAKLSTRRARKPPPRLHSPTPMRRRTTRSRSSSASAPWCALSPRRQRWRSEMATAAPAPKANMGEPAPRLDARAKVTGEARYASDVPINNPAYAFLLTSAIAKGRLERLDLDAARAVPGVLEIFTRENTAELKEIPFSAGGGFGAVKTKVNIVHADRNTPGFMRSPPVVPYIYALESAMDELAVKLGMDPIELRRINDTMTDPITSKPYSSRSLVQCYDEAAKSFGWSRRNPQPGSMRDGDWLIGWGCATAVYPTHVGTATARVRLLPTGEVRVQTAAHEIGNGAYTVIGQMAAERLGVSVAAVKVEVGDSALPPTPVAGGSNTTASACSPRSRPVMRSGTSCFGRRPRPMKVRSPAARP